MEKKLWHQSKTLWVNLIALVISIVGVLVTAAPDVGIDPQVVVVLTGIVVPLLNVWLRFVTDTGVKIK